MARTIAQRGVCLVATAHGTSIMSLLRNEDLTGLVGGITVGGWVVLATAHARAVAGAASAWVRRVSRARPRARTHAAINRPPAAGTQVDSSVYMVGGSFPMLV